MANSVDPDQTAPEAVWSGPALFAYAILSESLVYEILEHLPYFMTCSFLYDVETLIRLLGLHCLHMAFCQKF